MGSPNSPGSRKSVTDLRRTGAIAILTLASPPVNALSEALRLGIRDAITAAGEDLEVGAIVVIGAGRMFCGGADITEFGRPWQGIGLGALLDRVEDTQKPVVAAIHGMALGGGLELALACHYRIATPSARLGQPEVKLGLVPGAGGTQRLPRLIGTEKALDMIVSGDPIDGRTALDLGLVDALAAEDRLEAEAIAFAERVIAEERGPRRIRDSDARLEPGRVGLFAAAREAAARRYRGFEAPQACIACVEAAGTLPFAEGLAFEERTFFALMMGEPSIAQRHAFFAEREAGKIPDLPAATPKRPVRRVALLAGAADLAEVFSSAGLPVVLGETATPETVGACDLVVAPADGPMARLDALAGPDAIVALTGAEPDLDALAAGSAHPERVVGLRAGASASGDRLLEIMRGRATAPDVLATAMALGRSLGRVAVATRPGGFIGPRMLARLRREADRLILDGASPAQLARVLDGFGLATAGLGLADRAVASPERDEAVRLAADHAGIHRRAVSDDEILERCLDSLVNEGARLLDEGVALRASDIDVVWVTGYGWPAYRGGPMHWADGLGLPLLRDRLRSRAENLGPDFAPSPLLERLAAEGRRFGDPGRAQG
ncbi:3-hydroxyacyl-CoA dehydrogenase [Methylobacterium sp. BE186]|uniref:enoyl-CoA hydratase-related protein n=1 Tax=Methylobacterium sp. BE186 TaxID=2817715 RepID=UPI0028608F42|nr:enoyl-CoA hydratase-related protein [Methylobacterium sp. BE186]MDR7039390.1 3-hydroxyacyl-CoA dehydrogenase [Methylobacterium sp. BE186]